jgi:hypothetical protein
MTKAGDPRVGIWRLSKEGRYLTRVDASSSQNGMSASRLNLSWRRSRRRGPMRCRET